MKQRVLALLCALLMLPALAACGEAKPAESEAPPTEQATPEPTPDDSELIVIEPEQSPLPVVTPEPTPIPVMAPRRAGSRRVPVKRVSTGRTVFSRRPFSASRLRKAYCGSSFSRRARTNFSSMA